MKVMTAQKIRIFPSPEQEKVFIKACGTARYIYNWALNRWKELKAQGKEKVFKNELKAEWNQVKPAWVYDAPKDANQRPFDNLYSGFSRFYGFVQEEGTHEFIRGMNWTIKHLLSLNIC